MIRWLKKPVADSRGVAAVEFALVAPFVILTMLGTINFGQYYYASTSLRNAVDEAARYATLDPTPTETQIRTRFSDQRLGIIPKNAATLTITTTSVSTKANAMELNATWSMPINLVFARAGTVPVSTTRRIFVSK